MRRDSDVLVIRRHKQAVFGVWCAVFILFVTVYAVVSEPGSALRERAFLAAVMVGCSWGVWLMAKARVVVRPGGLTVVNPLLRYDIPWEAVDAVDVEHGVVVRLTDGRKIPLAVGSGSVIEGMRGRRGLHAIKKQLDSARAAHAPAGRSDRVTTRPDLHLLFLAAVLTVLLATTVFAG